MPKVFAFQGNTSIQAGGYFQIRVTDWDDDNPFDIVFSEFDIQSFESASTLSGSAQAGRGGGDYSYIGKIACNSVQRIGTDFFFELASRPLGLATAAEAPRLPVPFKVKIPTKVGDQQGIHEFFFYCTGDIEDRYEINVQINERNGPTKLAPMPRVSGEEETELFMVGGLRGYGRITQPRFLQIVQPYFNEELNPATHEQIPNDNDTLRQRCQDYITGRLSNISTIVNQIFNIPRYRNADTGRSNSWVRNVVECLTGSPYKNAALTYGGGPSAWRTRLKRQREYPICTVCDQLGSIIQWTRGVNEDYVDRGLNRHAEYYRTWANDSGLSSRGAVYHRGFSAANADKDSWAHPGASLFYYKVKWRSGQWMVKNGPGRNDYTPAITDDNNNITNTDAVIGHESTIIRTRERDGHTQVQLFDYGHNLQGPGRLRGSVGNLDNVAQESGWLPLNNIITHFDEGARPQRGERPARPASPRKFHSVGWRPEGDIRVLRRPIGNISLTISQGETELASLNRVEIEGRGSADPNVIKPITHYITSLSAMPHADLITAKYCLESTDSFGAGVTPIPLVDLITDGNGKINVVSRVE